MLEDADPALRWKVERDLLHEPEEVWKATKAKVATEGFGKRLLELQDADGQWAGGAYFPGGYDMRGAEAGQPWTATTWTLTTLREWGTDAAALGRTAALLAENSRWDYDGLPYWGGEVDCCINAMTVSNGLWLGVDVHDNVAWFVEHQLEDGGWNCEWVEGATRSSFHSTLNSLKGLLDYEVATGGTEESKEARKQGEEYLLKRNLFRRLSTGEPVAEWVDVFRYPLRWQYSVLNAADYFRRAALHDGTAPEPRVEEAVGRIEAQRQPDGTWVQAGRHPGRMWFEVDVAAGERSKWVTLYGARVLEWWDNG
ncbi:squalene cyclase [Nocardia sp. NRRL S-836]|nr:squalene cyclase [Nocardia sp. NRRL S-836]